MLGGRIRKEGEEAGRGGKIGGMGKGSVCMGGWAESD